VTSALQIIYEWKESEREYEVLRVGECEDFIGEKNVKKKKFFS